MRGSIEEMFVLLSLNVGSGYGGKSELDFPPHPTLNFVHCIFYFYQDSTYGLAWVCANRFCVLKGQPFHENLYTGCWVQVNKQNSNQLDSLAM